MLELKKFLNPLSPYQRMLYTILFSFMIFGGIFFFSIFFTSGFPFGMLIMPVGVFAAFGSFIYWMFRKSLHAYDNWWNSLTDAEHAEIEQDFQQAHQVSHYMLAGPRYAYIRHTGRVIPYEKIDRFDFRYAKNAHCYLHILLKDAPKVCVYQPSLSAAERLRADLLSYRDMMNGLT